MNQRIHNFSELHLEPDDTDIDSYMFETEAKHQVKPASHWQDELNEDFADQQQGSMHPRLPWSRLHDKVQIRPGEVSVWFGFNGHGKSLALGQVLLSLCSQGERACIASFEMKPRKTLGRMCRQFIDAAAPGPRQVSDFVSWAKGKVWLYNRTGSVDVARVYAVIRYAVDQLGITQFVVDNLTKCVASDDDYVGQKAIVDKLTSIAQDLGIHIHLVHHARKGADETRPPRKMDALGASAITNLVDNVFIIWRNKDKADHPELHRDEPDAMLICDKQRHGEWEGTLQLGYHHRSQQYLQDGSSAVDMREYPHLNPTHLRAVE